MKKLLSIVVAALLVVVACFALTACSNSDPKGTYKFDSMTRTEGGQTITLHIGDEIYPGMTLTEDFMVLELKDGDVAVVTEGEAMEGTWKQDGKKITVTIGNNPMDFTLDGNKLIASFEGQEMVLIKK